jgi:hypothetical protein
MRRALKFLQTYPFLVLTYTTYLTLSTGVLQAAMNFREARVLTEDEPGYIACGQGVAFGYLFMRFLAILYLAIVALKIIFSREKRLYCWLALLVVIPFLVISLYNYW